MAKLLRLIFYCVKYTIRKNYGGDNISDSLYRNIIFFSVWFTILFLGFIAKFRDWRYSEFGIYSVVFLAMVVMGYKKSRAVELPPVPIIMLPGGRDFLMLYLFLSNLFSTSIVFGLLIGAIFPLRGSLTLSVVVILLFNMISAQIVIFRGRRAVDKFYF